MPNLQKGVCRIPLSPKERQSPAATIMKRTPIKRKPKRHVNLTPEVIAEVNQRADETVGYGKCERCGNYPDFRGLAMCEPLKQMGGTTKIFEAKEVQRCCYPCHLIKDHGIKEVKSEPMWSSKS